MLASTRIPTVGFGTGPLGLKTFRNSIERAAESKVLAANQGLYNDFLAAGLVWGLVHGNPGFAFQIKVFFLLCVIVVGVYGAATVSRGILYVQAAPAALALIMLWLAKVPKERSSWHFLQCHTPSSTLALAMAPGAAGQDHRQKREEVAI